MNLPLIISAFLLKTFGFGFFSKQYTIGDSSKLSISGKGKVKSLIGD